MNESTYQLLVGIDWGSETHRITVLDPAGRLVAERAVPHEGAALQAFAAWLAERAAPHVIAVAIEVPHGAVVDTMLEHGFHVFALNPRQMDRFRDRHSMAGAKDDRRDALVMASALRTDRPAFRRLEPEDPMVIQLRELSRIERELETERQRLSNRLREQLWRFYPQALQLCPAADERWFWALLKVAPTPAAARALKRATVAAVLKKYRIRRVTTDTVLATLRTTPLAVAAGAVEAALAHIGVLLPRLALVVEQERTCEQRITHVLAELARRGEQQGHRDVTILQSLPGVGRTVTATMLAEAWRPLASRDYHALRAQGGSAPVTRQSGKRRLVAMRYACNTRLRTALHHWGSCAKDRDPLAREHYLALRQRGYNHARAVRGVIDRLLAVLIAMLRTQTLYDPTRRHRLAAANLA